MSNTQKSNVDPAITRRAAAINPALAVRRSLGHPDGMDVETIDGTPDNSPIPAPVPVPVTAPSQEPVTTAIVVAANPNPDTLPEYRVTHDLFRPLVHAEEFTAISDGGWAFGTGDTTASDWSPQQVMGFYKEFLTLSVEREIDNTEQLRGVHMKAFPTEEEFEFRRKELLNFLIEVYWNKLNPPCTFSTFKEHAITTPRPITYTVEHSYALHCRRRANTKLSEIRNSMYKTLEESRQIKDTYNANRKIAKDFKTASKALENSCVKRNKPTFDAALVRSVEAHRRLTEIENTTLPSLDTEDTFYDIDKDNRDNEAEMDLRALFIEETNRTNAIVQGTASSKSTASSMTTPDTSNKKRKRTEDEGEDEDESEDESDTDTDSDDENAGKGEGKDENADKDSSGKGSSGKGRKGSSGKGSYGKKTKAVHWTRGNCDAIPVRKIPVSEKPTFVRLFEELPDDSRTFYEASLCRILTDEKKRKQFEAFLKRCNK